MRVADDMARHLYKKISKRGGRGETLPKFGSVPSMQLIIIIIITLFILIKPIS